MPGAEWCLLGPEPESRAAAPEGRRVWAREWQDGCRLGGQSQGAVSTHATDPEGLGGAPELRGARPRTPGQTEARAGGRAPGAQALEVRDGARGLPANGGPV